MVDPPYLIDLIDLIRPGCPFSAIQSLYVRTSKVCSSHPFWEISEPGLCNVLSDVIHALVLHMQETAPEVRNLYAGRT